MFVPSDSTVPKLQTAKDLQGDVLLHYNAEIKLMNLILLSIPNDIHNSVDACISAKDMWKRVERLMRGTIQNTIDRETCFINEFDHFVAEPGEALVFVYNRFAQLMNDLERYDIHFLIVTINTKFLNSLQPEWLKYVTQVRLAKRLTVDTFDDLFDYLQQFEKLRRMSEKEDCYHDTIIDLEDKRKKNVDLILKLGNSLQRMFMLGPKPLFVYDQQLKHGLGYSNPYTLKQAISQYLKLYLASSLDNSEILLNVRDNEDTLDDASKSQQKVKEKMNDPIVVANKQNCWTIDYQQINALYKDFVP
nr:hypothetical protein [Tanacetum cinerariifolium]